MNSFFPVAMVSGHDGLIPKMPADPNDRHVLAAAVHSRCDVLVTDNLKDFSPPMAGPYAMRVEKLIGKAAGSRNKLRPRSTVWLRLTDRSRDHRPTAVRRLATFTRTTTAVRNADLQQPKTRCGPRGEWNHRGPWRYQLGVNCSRKCCRILRRRSKIRSGASWFRR
jgi:hypothetical protein